MLTKLIGSVRRNHALEHATISVLMGRIPPDTRLVGRAASNGFYIYGNVPSEDIEASAEQGLARLRSGEEGLAVSPLCGTNLVVAGVLAGLAATASAGNRSRWERLPSVLLASMLAVVAAQPLGRMVQKYVTTSPDVGDLKIVEVRGSKRGRGMFYKVETAPK
jgi:Domain of unknown function (DUF6391)